MLSSATEFTPRSSAPRLAHHSLQARQPVEQSWLPLPGTLVWALTWLLAGFLMLHAGSLPPRRQSTTRPPVLRRTRLQRCDPRPPGTIAPA